MRYIHYIAFVTDKFGNQEKYTGIKSNNKMLSRKELINSMDEVMKKEGVTMYHFGIIGVSTFLNK